MSARRSRATTGPVQRPVLRAEGVTKTYGGGPVRVTAVGGVDLDAAEGEVLALTGASGSGKTTLLHCLAGLTPVDAGRVLLDDVDLATLDDDRRTDLRARSFGLVLQRDNLIGALTVAENVELPLVVSGVPAADVRARRADALTAVGVPADVWARLPAGLSGGEQQRVAVARVLAASPRVVFADEPTAALDSVSAASIVDLLRALAQTGAAVIVATHDGAVAAAADRRVVLRDGRRVS